LDLKAREWQEAGEHCIMRSLIITVVKSRKMRWGVMYHARRIWEMRAEFCSENLMRRDNLGKIGIDEKIILK
jgi:hypothetical protein